MFTREESAGEWLSVRSTEEFLNHVWLPFSLSSSMSDGQLLPSSSLSELMDHNRFSLCLSAGSLAISLFNIWSSRCFIIKIKTEKFWIEIILFLYEFKVFRNYFILKSTTFLLAFSWNLMDIYLSCLLLFLKLQFLFFFQVV